MRPDRSAGSLAALGLTESEEAGYELLVDRSPATYSELLAGWGGADNLLDVLTSLVAKGLVVRVPGDPERYTAVAPDVALEALLLGAEQELRLARAEARRLAETYRERSLSPGRTVVELVTGRAALGQRVAQLRRAASKELRCLNRPPYGERGGPAGVELDAIAAEVAVRAIYDRSVVDQPAAVAELDRLTGAGGEVRVLPGVPLKLLLADDRLALLVLQPQPGAGAEVAAGEPDTALVIYGSGLLEALHSLFEGLWHRAVPVTPVAEPADADQERLIGLLLSGLTDRAIARELGIGYRTAQRRIAALMRSLGATTRFQAGVKAASHARHRGHDR